jgi:hypothetical protein
MNDQTNTGTTTTEQTSSTTPEAGTAWINSLPEAYRNDPNIVRFSTTANPMEALLASQVGYSKAHGVPAEQLLRMPREDDADGWGQLYGRLGRPEAADKYDLAAFNTKNEGDKAFVEGFRGKAFELGYTQRQMAGMLDYLNTSLATVDQQLEAQAKAYRDAGEAELRKAWGQKYDTYKNEIPGVVEKLTAKACLSAEEAKGVYEKLNADGLTDNPIFMRMLGAMADLMAEPGAAPGGAGGSQSTGALTPADAKSQMAAFNSNPAKQAALYNTSDPGHRAAKEEWQKLIEAMSA